MNPIQIREAPAEITQLDLASLASVQGLLVNSKYRKAWILDRWL